MRLRKGYAARIFVSQFTPLSIIFYFPVADSRQNCDITKRFIRYKSSDGIQEYSVSKNDQT